MAQDQSGLRVSTVIREFDEVIRTYDECSQPKSASCEASCENDKGPTDEHPEMSNGETSLQRCSRLNESNDFLEEKDLESEISGSRRSRESVFISDVFSFLPPEEGDAKQDGEPSADLTSNRQGGDPMNNGTLRDGEPTVLVPSAPRCADILREKCRDPDPGMSRCDGEQDVRESRVISMEFKFLSKYGSENERSEKMLSAVQEGDEHPDDSSECKTEERGMTDTAAADTNHGVIMRHESASLMKQLRPSNISRESSTCSDSEDDDNDDVRINPGAWRKSKFIYVNDSSDTASDCSGTSSPLLVMSLRPSRAVSIYPPATLGSESDRDAIQPSEADNPDSDHCEDDDSGPSSMNEREDSVLTTASEQEFRVRYRSLKKTRIMRNASLGKGDNSPKPVIATVCREIFIEMDDGETEFGFHIWGSKPVIVSTIKEGSAADRAGLQVGNVILKVNSIDVSEASTNEVVQITGRARNVTFSIAKENKKLDVPICCGYLSKQGGSLLMKKWQRRWVELKTDNCIYYYKKKGDLDPLGAVPVVNYTVTKATEVKYDFAFKLTKYGARTYYFIADSDTEMSRWADAIRKAASEQNEQNVWLDISSHNVSLPALRIRNPVCHGYLHKMGNNMKTWRRRYCVLKEGCLYYYVGVNSSTAKGVAHFHGYTVQDSVAYGKPNSFMLVPPESDMRTFCFYADNEMEKKRWIVAFQESLSKWVMVSE